MKQIAMVDNSGLQAPFDDSLVVSFAPLEESGLTVIHEPEHYMQYYRGDGRTDVSTPVFIQDSKQEWYLNPKYLDSKNYAAIKAKEIRDLLANITAGLVLTLAAGSPIIKQDRNMKSSWLIQNVAGLIGELHITKNGGTADSDFVEKDIVPINLELPAGTIYTLEDDNYNKAPSFSAPMENPVDKRFANKEPALEEA